jgi:sacsin
VKVDVCATIRNIINDYPPHSIFKEMLQNADDAGATRLTLILDRRRLPFSSLVGDGMRALQGPALLVHNDRAFAEQDLQRVCRIFSTGKRERWPAALFHSPC